MSQERGASSGHTAPGTQRTSVERVNVTLWSLIAACTVLGLGHHVDHALRDATGWPFPGHAISPFTPSLLVYPAIGILTVLTLRGVAGPGSWSLFTGLGAVFIAAVHFGPVADDTISMVRNGYSTAVAGTAAVVWLTAQLTALAATCVLRSVCVGASPVTAARTPALPQS